MRRLALALSAFLLGTGTAHAQVPISTCGAVVPAKQVGVLQNDLDCGDLGGFCPDCTKQGCTVGAACETAADCPTMICNPIPAVRLEQGARLDMNGHRISAPGRSAVQCGAFLEARRCGVFSSVGRGVINDCTTGILAGRAVVDVTDVEVNGCVVGAWSSQKLRLKNVSADGNNNSGFLAKDIDATNVSASNSLGFGFAAGIERFRRPGHSSGPFGRIRGTDITATGNGQAGVFSTDTFKIVNLTATGNGFALGGPQSGGIVGTKGGVLKNSTVTGNVNGPAHDPLDVFTAKPPHLIDTICGTSGRYPDKAVSWGVCSDD
jgi:hypothetical protein